MTLLSAHYGARARRIVGANKLDLIAFSPFYMPGFGYL